MSTTSRLSQIFFPALLLFGWWIASPAGVQAQNAGNNAVYNSSGALAASTSYIDASLLSGADICAKIHTALGTIAAGSTAVIDARGITTNLTCPVAKTPWVYTTTVTAPATILFRPALGSSAKEAGRTARLRPPELPPSAPARPPPRPVHRT